MQQAIPTQPRPLLAGIVVVEIPLLLLLNLLSLPPSFPSRHHFYLLCNLQPMSFSTCRTTADSYCRLGYADDPDKDVT